MAPEQLVLLERLGGTDPVARVSVTCRNMLRVCALGLDARPFTSLGKTLHLWEAQFLLPLK